MIKALQKRERNIIALENQHANYKQEKDHNAKPTTKKSQSTIEEQ